MPNLTNPVETDLLRSGLRTIDVDAFSANETHIAATGAFALIQQVLDSGHEGPVAYVIPYYDINGKRIPFYRLRMLGGHPKQAKYLQPQGAPSYVYFPKNFQENLARALEGKGPSKVNGYDPVLMIVEGEKKAARASKEGYLTVGLGGVYNWKTRTIQLPGDAKFEKSASTRSIIVRLPQKTSEITDEITDEETFEAYGSLAPGMQELIDLVRYKGLQVVIVFDSDNPIKPEVQKAAASLAFELRNKGIPTNRIRQVILPATLGQKIGIDDFLELEGTKAFEALLHDALKARNAFPRHPNIRATINAKLQKLTLKRSQIRELALTIIADMDSRGMRMKESGSGDPFYFDSVTKHLMPVAIMQSHGQPLHESQFGEFLYREYDLSQADNRILPWIASAFTGEEPVYTVAPRAVSAVLDDSIAYQINDGQYILVTGDPENPWTIHDNGTNGILFRGGMVEPINSEAMTAAMTRLEATHKRQAPNWWGNTLRNFRVLRPTDIDLVSMLFYVSPFLMRWRGTQLPFEMAVGEPGSGKSSMYALRQMILTGRPMLKNLPQDLRDWYASVTSVGGGMHVTDNVHFATKELRQRISDEICRIVTEPDPNVELRKLFTTSDNYRMPVRCAFAVTAVQQPFINADILQRSVIFELGAVATNHDSDWTGHQIQTHGGRAAWLAHHMWVLHGFFRRVPSMWKGNYRSGHRLANFEQIIKILGTTIQMPQESVDTLISNLQGHVEDQVSDYDWTMEALQSFVHQWMESKDANKPFTTQHIAEWASVCDDFLDNTIVTSSRRLARYMKSHKTMVERVAGIIEHGTYANRVTYIPNPAKYGKK